MKNLIAIVIASHLVLWGGATADFMSTRLAIHRGAVEANPVAGQNWKQQAAVMYGATAATALVSGLAERAGHPKMARWCRYITGGVHFGAAGWNLKVWSSLR